MSDESIFSQDPATNVEPNPVPQISLPQEAVELVGEGKKYKSVEDALKSIPHAQSHIQKLEEEMKQMREELTKRKAAEELLEEFKVSGVTQEKPSSPALDTNQLAALVDQTLEQREAKKIAENNIKSVIDSFNAKFGESAPQMYEKIAADNGLSVQFLNSVAAKSPEAVFRLAGIYDKPQAVAGKTAGSVNTAALQQAQQPQTLSAKLPKGATTKDLVSAWKNAGQMVKQELGIN